MQVPQQDITFRKTPDGVELVEAPEQARITWKFFDNVTAMPSPNLTIADGDITLRCTNATAVYRIVGAETLYAVVERVSFEETDGK
ncbi:hypothetical protein [Streptomyces sp. CBMA29]|uniref:hypothetical protein n=1 Tax=Streptomyces sp. CBMA29 TaxID=1896314 RepID=UPI00166211E7|nr:hypothetical protein [Streptomyces sp. CBMA29]MBD0734014.1 hypothetical protein [Streptomyces sp. CBMA29]